MNLECLLEVHMNSKSTGRNAEAKVDDQFLDRWSPRAYSSKPVPEELLQSLFEAARWAPSCYNDQPWLFLYAREEKELEYYRPLLADGNRVWTDTVPVLMFLLSRKQFAHNNKPNNWAVFDAGAAWMSLALQARKLGLYAHGMAGFHKDKVYEVLQVPEQAYEVVCAIAVGYYGDPSQLPEDVREREKPSGRKPLSEVSKEGKFI
jgi:nitroreductase